MRALVIGGTGLIGPYVVEQLCEKAYEVTVFHRGEHETALPANVRHVHSELAAMPVRDFPSKLLAWDFDVLIHMIAMGEADARAAVQAFTGRTGRIVVLSSGDVYRAYGRLTRLEEGEPEGGLLSEDSPLRGALYPYRAQAASADDFRYHYEKILVEQQVLQQPELPAAVLRLPKVYGPRGNGDLATVYGFRNHPTWRWTHGYVENVAAAIVLAAQHPLAPGRVFNVGEEHTPTVAERLESLPPTTMPLSESSYDFRHHIAYDTSRIRRELGYVEPVPYDEGIRRTLAGSSGGLQG